MPQGQSHSLVPTLIIAVLVIGLFAWRLRRMSQTQRLRLELLWVTPVIFIALGALVVLQQPPQGIAWAYVAASLVIGGGFGWWRGKLMTIAIDAQTHALNVRASPAGVIFIVAIIAVRYALRGVAMGEASSLHLSVGVITDVFMGFAVGLMVVQRVEMFLRARRLLGEARAARAAAASQDPVISVSP
jgi:hypothetical protein